MKFLFITATPLNSIEGSGTYVGIETLKRALEELGHVVKILAPDFWCPNFVLKRYLFNCRVPRLVERGGPVDAIVGFDCDGFRLNNASVPYIVNIKCVLADEAKQEKGIIMGLLRLQAKWEMENVKKADFVITISQYCKKMIERNYGIEPGKIHIVPELIDIGLWEKLLASAPVRPREENITVLTVCRMYPRKNLGLLLRAWSQVRKKEPSAVLRIVGSGQEYKCWVALSRQLQLGKSVVFLGDRTREELAQEYKNCDIFCLPSRQEGFGIVFLEAMAAGKPIVAARAAAVPEVIWEGQNGLLVSPDDIEGLAEALLRLIRGPKLRLDMGKYAQYSVQRYESAKIASQFLSVFQRPFHCNAG